MNLWTIACFCGFCYFTQIQSSTNHFCPHFDDDSSLICICLNSKVCTFFLTFTVSNISVSHLKTTVRSRFVIPHLLPVSPQLQSFINVCLCVCIVLVFAGGPSFFWGGGVHPHVVCLTSSPLSPKHCCCAAFKSTGNVLKVCIHSFSFSLLQCLHSGSLAVTVFRIINSLCCLIAFVGN